MTSRDAIEIRRATVDDAEAICRVAIRSLHETNARDYAADVIATLVAGFFPQRIAAFISSRPFFVAILGGAIVGTGNLDGAEARAMFVDPDHQGKGIGAALMAAIENLARTRAVTTLRVESSITAEGFYRKLGYVLVGQRRGGGTGPTITMEKRLVQSTAAGHRDAENGRRRR